MLQHGTCVESIGGENKKGLLRLLTIKLMFLFLAKRKREAVVVMCKDLANSSFSFFGFMCSCRLIVSEGKAS